jgi:hypothetical protein
MNSKRCGRKQLMAYFKVLSQHFLVDLRKTRENLRITGLRTKN